MRHVTLTSYRPAAATYPGEPPAEVALAVEATDHGVVRVVAGPGAVAARWEDTGTVPTAWIAGVVGALRGDAEAGRAVPIDWDALPSTGRERRIWNFVRGLGPGQTASAEEVAEAVTTDAEEAVGPLPTPADARRACARDPIPALIPCGRVRAAADDGTAPASAPAPASRGKLPRVRSGLAAAARLVIATPFFLWFVVVKRARIRL